MRRWLVGVWVAALAAPAGASPERDACVAKGRKQADARAHREAFATFEECLKLAPGDEVVLSERVAAALAGKLAGTEQLARAAVAAARTPAVRAASLYSLALAEHDYPDVHLEVEALKASLRLRPDAAVSARLEKVKPGATVEPSFAAMPMAGPYGSIDAWCQIGVPADRQLADVGMRHFPGGLKCGCAPKIAPASADGPFDQVSIVEVACAHTDATAFIDHLAVRTKDGWYVSAILEAFPEREASCLADHLQVGPPEASGSWVVVRTSWTDACDAYSYVRDLAYEHISIAGLGPSGKPSLVGPITLGNHHVLFDDDGQGPVRRKPMTDWHLDARLTPAGELELSGTPKDWSPELIHSVVGKHALTFP